jgi:hypothetical protein
VFRFVIQDQSEASLLHSLTPPGQYDLGLEDANHRGAQLLGEKHLPTPILPPTTSLSEVARSEKEGEA